MSKELTPMQELKNRLFDVRINQNPITLKEMNGYIEKEKQVIEDFFEQGFLTLKWDKKVDNEFEKYYNTKYKNYEI